MTQNHGWVNGGWKKDPIQFGFSGVATQAFSNTNLSAGNNSIDGSAVPAGEIWIITNVVLIYFGTVTRIFARSKIGGSYFTIFAEETPVTGKRYDRSGWWVFDSGDCINMATEGATVGDDIYLEMIGFRVDIDQ